MASSIARPTSRLRLRRSAVWPLLPPHGAKINTLLEHREAATICFASFAGVLVTFYVLLLTAPAKRYAQTMPPITQMRPAAIRSKPASEDRDDHAVKRWLRSRRLVNGFSAGRACESSSR
jgi:hypothetical protein